MDGILPLHKPAGWTSHDCVMKVRKIVKTKKVGHTGTLDPEVTGVLPICIGRATKVVEYLTDAPKTYEGEVTLGIATETEDSYGEVIAAEPVERTFSRSEILQVLATFTGQIEQIPPMYSAVKVNGKRLYEYARAGIEVDRPKRNVTIFELELLDDREVFSGHPLSFSFRVTASKGTYVRTLAVDIGKALGYPAHMSHLVRTASGPFTLPECLTLDEVEGKMQDGSLDKSLLSVEKALQHFPAITVTDDVAAKVKNGAVLAEPENLTAERFVMQSEDDRVLAVYKKHPRKPGLIKPEKVLFID